MNILYIDKPSLQLQIRIQNLEDSGQHTVEMADNLGDVYIMFQKEKYDMVIIDHGIENGMRYIEHINDVDPEQKILVVSDAVTCIYQQCDECVEKHHVRRLNNPTTMKNIMRMVNGFELYACDHYDPETKRFDNNHTPHKNHKR